MSEVQLYVYDLSRGMASQLSAAFLGRHLEGIWHTSIVVYGREYFFGAGVMTAQPGASMHGSPLRVHSLGTTHIPQEVFHEFLEGLSSTGRFTADSYHLLDQNCNSFSQEAAQFLLQRDIPDYIRSLPADFESTPMGRMLRPMIDSFFANGRAGETPFTTSTQQPFSNLSGNQAAAAALTRNLASTAVSGKSPVAPVSTPPVLASVSAAARKPHVFEQYQIRTIMAKLKSFLAENAASFSTPAPAADAPVSSLTAPLTNAQQAALDSLDALLSNSSASPLSALKATGEHLTLLRDLLRPFSSGNSFASAGVHKYLHTQQLFPALDLLRVWLLTAGAIELVAATQQTEPWLPFLIASLATTPASGAAESVPDSAKLLALRIACNMFFTEAGSQLMVSTTPIASEAYRPPQSANAAPSPCSLAVEAAVQGLLSQNKNVRQAASTLAFNFAVYLHPEKQAAHADLIAELTTALQHVAPVEEDEETAFRQLSALQLLVKASPDAKQLLQALGFETAALAKKGGRLVEQCNQLSALFL